LLKVVFSVGYATRIYNENSRPTEEITEREPRVGSSAELCKGG
jgi:hypothetical protein